jgi:hypothetical protein
MSCEIASGRERTCRNGFGGIDEAVLFNYDDIETLTIVNGVVTALTLIDGKRAYRYQFEDMSSFHNEDFVGSRPAGTNVVTATLSMYLNDFESVTRVQTNTLIKARFVALVKYSKGHWVASGISRAGHMIDTCAYCSCTAHEDADGISLVSSVQNRVFAPTVS